ncbi:protein disulfide-isomerase A4-like [Gigantopelta aegis]|uniref:protein disulfide-isomerase A4-like n=1 Tax=Gigantopelta aegis TaxID=1735272 RepID=UPI001B8883BE|nr:protein disulfide-isomerase A4-like [Gigantopelta aegis]
MKFYVLLLCLLVSTPIIKCADEEEDEAQTDGETEDETDKNKDETDDVLVLTEKNFEDALKDHDVILVEFYAPWCGHCKHLAPEYAKAATQLKDLTHPVALAKVDATVETELAQRYDVSGYPTLMWFKKGTKYDYDGPREETGIVKYMTERSDPEWKPPPEAVLTLTKENFEDVVNTEELILVEFYAPWCGHCKKLAPLYEKAAQRLKDYDPPIPLAKIDATVNSEIATEHMVTGYPTLKIFRKGKSFEYNGERDEHAIVNYMIDQQGDAAKLLATVKAVKDFMQKDDITVMGFFSNLGDPRLSEYKDTANDFRDVHKFGYTLDEDARNLYKINPGSVVVFNAEKFYTKYEPKWHILHQGKLTREDMVTFIKKHQVPLVGHYERETEKLYDDLRPLCLVFYTVDWSFEYRTATQLWRQKIAAIAKDYKNITFAIANEDDYQLMLKEFGFDDSGEEMNIGILGKDGKKFPMELMEEFDPDEITDFLNAFQKGKIKPQIKSQPVPKKQTGPVTVVVGKTFEEIVNNPSKDVLIEMYAPWCGHCKQLEPVYKELAKKYKTEKNLIIAKLDATANDVPELFKAEGFPTIYFSAACDKTKPKKFGGARELKDFVTFLEENACVSLGKNYKDEL